MSDTQQLDRIESILERIAEALEKRPAEVHYHFDRQPAPLMPTYPVYPMNPWSPWGITYNTDTVSTTGPMLDP